jgi:hypothetical protein
MTLSHFHGADAPTYAEILEDASERFAEVATMAATQAGAVDLVALATFLIGARAAMDALVRRIGNELRSTYIAPPRGNRGADVVH